MKKMAAVPAVSATPLGRHFDGSSGEPGLAIQLEGLE